MDRYVIREPRVGVDYHEGNQMIPFLANSSGNTFTIPQNMYYSYGSAAPGHVPQSPALVVTPAHTHTTNSYPRRGQIVSGIDPRYLASYSDNNASLITAGYGEPQTPTEDTFGVNYQNHNFIGPERSDNKHFITRTRNVTIPASYACVTTNQQMTLQQKTPEAQSKYTEINIMKDEEQVKVKTRKDKLKELHVTGTRVFSGPVEKILKWNKSLQNIGVMVLYEVVGKCMSVRPGERSAKNLVVRDESGPAIQVVYYEIDCVLPELTPPCTVRVVGRMLSGSSRTSRLQAFSVHVATADDVTVLPRRSDVAAHHVTKLCEQYGD